MNDRLQSEAVTPAVGFVLRATAWIVLLFGALRLERVQSALLIPFASVQERLAAMCIGRTETGVVVDQSCTGSDALALCLGAILAFPASWTRRLIGAAAGFLLITAVNTVRIGQLATVVDRRELFNLLHLKLWPAAIILVAAGYVFFWMRAVPAPQSAAPAGRMAVRSPLWRFVTPALVLVALYYLVVDRLYESAAVQTAAHWAASLAGGLMTVVGVEASVAGGLLRTPHGFWLVTPQCVLTPLLPVYLAAALAAPIAWRRKMLALAAAPILFLALGSARLLILALPPALVGSHMVAVHAFYQLLAALAMLAWAARRAAPDSVRDWIRLLARCVGLGVLAALVLGLLDVFALAPLLGTVLANLHLGHGAADPQGVLLFLLAFQVGLYVAASRALGTRIDDSRWALGLATAALVAVTTRIVLGEVAVHASLEAPTVVLRAWALVVPLLLAWITTGRNRPPAPSDPGSAMPEPPDADDSTLPRRAVSAYRDFWTGVGDSFPDLGGAPSTAYYRDCERHLFDEYLQPLENLRILKTDLWDEAKNTRILNSAAADGAAAWGIDISLPIAVQAAAGFAHRGLSLHAVAADVRHVPFSEGQFDAVYSMGTVEHFDETAAAVGEIFRALRPGGKAIIGVPNRHDPFLRPLLVAVLYRLGLYGYGFEKSYSRAALRRMCLDAGFEIEADTGVLFIPGWLRMLDLAAWVWCRPLSGLTGLLVRPFAWLYRRFPALRRHGYLIAVVARRPAEPDAG